MGRDLQVVMQAPPAAAGGGSLYMESVSVKSTRDPSNLAVDRVDSLSQ